MEWNRPKDMHLWCKLSINSQSKNVILRIPHSWICLLLEMLYLIAGKGVWDPLPVSGRTQKPPQNHKFNARSKFVFVTSTAIGYNHRTRSLLEDHQTCCLHLCFRGQPRSDLPLYVNISPRRPGISSSGVPLSLSETYVV